VNPKKKEEETLENSELKQKMENLEITEQTTTGQVESFGNPIEIQTRFGPAYRLPINVKTNNTTIPISIIIRTKTLEKTHLHPRSNLYKLLTKYNCKRLRDLIDKTVQIRIDERGFYRIVY
jgi:hypothetical protein